MKEGKIVEGKLSLVVLKGTTVPIEVNGNEIIVDETRKIVIHLKAS